MDQPIPLCVGRQFSVAKPPQPGCHCADPEIAGAVFKDGLYSRIRQLLCHHREINELAVLEQTETSVGADPYTTLAAFTNAPGIVVAQTLLS